ncbi:hypothetical protein AQUCO_00500303v1 [Aquilegia coerulea]|uniref:Uncharacterized protein n=1 Tax=Aquilegia coerulea TaxID=218851 RepID=A0A2G5ERC0_AQUCA|nr:hypothetical protein AQUCO_00500303v1 [Aquilegia coerulea]
MATSAFKSTTKRSSSITRPADIGSSNRYHRSRSLSRVPSPEPPPTRGRKFVNTVRGSGAFPEINLDLKLNLDDNNDADEDFFSKLKLERSRSVTRRRSGISYSSNSNSNSSGATTTAAQRRSRSVSRPHSSRVIDDRNGGKMITSGSSISSSNSGGGGRRRSASVARYQFSDSESDVEHSHKSSHHADVRSSTSWNNRKPSLHKPETPSHQRVLKRSQSKIELSKPCDGYSSHSSALTDEDARESHSNNSGNERTIRAVYSQKKPTHPTGDGVETGLYEVLRQELRYAVDDIRTEIEQGMVKGNHSLMANDDPLQSNNSDLQAISMIRKNYTAKLEQSEKRKQDLLAEIVAEEQRVQELSKIVKELPPDPKNTAVQEKSLLGRKNNDKSWMSKSLIEDAEKYFDDFLSNVEDTDISSFDGERSDTSSTIGLKKPRDLVLHLGEREKDGFSTRSTSHPVEMDGVVLPWLQWETSNDGSPSAPKSKGEVQLNPEDNLCGSAQGGSSTYDGSKFSPSCKSLSPGGGSDNKFVDRRGYLPQSPDRGPKESYFDMDEYLHMQRSEEIIFEAWRQRHRIGSGALILCSGSSHQL